MKLFQMKHHWCFPLHRRLMLHSFGYSQLIHTSSRPVKCKELCPSENHAFILYFEGEQQALEHFSRLVYYYYYASLGFNFYVMLKQYRNNLRSSKRECLTPVLDGDRTWFIISDQVCLFVLNSVTVILFWVYLKSRLKLSTISFRYGLGADS